MSDLRYHEGRSIHEDRQTRPHAHCILPLKGTDYVYAADLGTDKIHIYKLSEGTLVENDPSLRGYPSGAESATLGFRFLGKLFILD